MRNFTFVLGAIFAASTAVAQEAGSLSAQEHAVRHFAQDDEAGYHMRSFDWSAADQARIVSSGGAGTYETAMEHFAQVDEPEFGLRRWSEGTSDLVVGTSRGATETNLSDFAAAKLDTGERGDN